MAATDNTIERLMDLTVTLLNATQGLTLDQIVSELPNYPRSSSVASRQQVERDKVLLRKRGVEVEVSEKERKKEAIESARSSTLFSLARVVERKTD